MARPLAAEGSSDATVVAVHEERGAICRSILGELPDWFGIPSAVDAYVEHAQTAPMFARFEDGRAVGFLSITQHPAAVEIHVMGVRPSHHRRGMGRQLVDAAEHHALREGFGLMTVKTLSARSDNVPYARTRAFYEALGYVAIDDLPTLWGPANPAVVLAKRL